MPVPIIFATQSGNSQFLSSLINHPYTYPIDIALFPLSKLLHSPVLIFIVSTHGDGDPPFSMRSFWNFIMYAGNPENLFAGVSFAIFGLGDSSYSSYNFCARKLARRLEQLGASPLIPLTLGDAQHPRGYSTMFEPWVKDLCAALNTLNISHVPKIEPEVSKPKYKAVLIKKCVRTPPSYTPIIIELTFQLKWGSFHPGDCIGITPENWNYREFMDYNEIGDENISLIKSKLDINFIPSQNIFKYLKGGEELAIDYDLYYDYVIKAKRTFFEVIMDFHTKVDIEFLIKHVPLIRPRYYTMIKRDGFYSILVTIVEYNTYLKASRIGLCTQYLKMLEIGASLDVEIVESVLRFETNNVLFVSTGVGVALPLAYLNFYKNKTVKIVYGFRYKGVDCLYEPGDPSNSVDISMAISRENGEYVQHVLKRIWKDEYKEYTLILSGSYKLNKEIKLLLKELGVKMKIQSETW
ncbi:NADPH-dependent diflavin oxidoreductase 1 [Astathelohania contejeani]|uniref:NADPH-dependent diflavin oxidoreductase 1 n=1 Tax=Astathelohania contejeani TaxID=164912 RepID=A0ABQ7I2K0_9MICR|nr:NADPH-dependent diflavin oxidoreductase 1 [Thelohania contejeani]